jgi:hypothetical protein
MRTVRLCGPHRLGHYCKPYPHRDFTATVNSGSREKSAPDLTLSLVSLLTRSRSLPVESSSQSSVMPKQEPPGLDAVLIKRAGRPRHMRHPSNLAFDPGDEHPDIDGNTFGQYAQDPQLQCPHPVTLLRPFGEPSDRQSRDRAAAGTTETVSTRAAHSIPAILR